MKAPVSLTGRRLFLVDPALVAIVARRADMHIGDLRTARAARPHRTGYRRIGVTAPVP